MQSIAAISWFPTTALICGLIFGVMTLGCACLMILKEQRPSRASVTLAVLGALLLIVSIWQSRGGSLHEMQVKIAELEQQTVQLGKTIEELSGQQADRTTTLSDNDTRLHTSLSSLQEASTQQAKRITTLGQAQEQLSTSLTAVKQQNDQNAGQMKTLNDQHEQASTGIQNQLEDYQTKTTEHDRLLDYVMTGVAKLRGDFSTMAADQSRKFEDLEKQRRILAKKVDGIASQHQVELTSLREDVEASSAQGQVLNFVKVSTQRELSNLRREVDRLQEHMQRLQSRRHRTP